MLTYWKHMSNTYAIWIHNDNNIIILISTIMWCCFSFSFQARACPFYFCSIYIIQIMNIRITLRQVRQHVQKWDGYNFIIEKIDSWFNNDNNNQHHRHDSMEEMLFKEKNARWPFNSFRICLMYIYFYSFPTRTIFFICFWIST